MATILIVEDEPFSRMVAEAAVKDLGHIPLSASDGEAAIGLARSAKFLTILFTDINMPPGPDGWTVAREIRLLHPAIRVIYTSGQAGIDEHESLGVPGSLMLSKPYTAGELAAAIVGEATAG